MWCVPRKADATGKGILNIFVPVTEEILFNNSFQGVIKRRMGNWKKKTNTFVRCYRMLLKDARGISPFKLN